MNAFINGAISAFNKCLNLIKILDPEGKDQKLNDMKNQINIYIKMYKDAAIDRDAKPIIDETWKKIKEASNLSDEDLEELEKVIFDA